VLSLLRHISLSEPVSRHRHISSIVFFCLRRGQHAANIKVHSKKLAVRQAMVGKKQSPEMQRKELLTCTSYSDDDTVSIEVGSRGRNNRGK
jgi:hypothetical protein